MRKLISFVLAFWLCNMFCSDSQETNDYDFAK